MGKVLSVIGGIIAAVAGLFLLVTWWTDFAACFRGMLPAFLILVGLIAAFAGISEIKDEAARKKEETKKAEEKK